MNGCVIFVHYLLLEIFTYFIFIYFDSTFCFLFFSFIQFLFILFSWSGRGAPGKCTRSPYGSAEHRLGTSGLEETHLSTLNIRTVCTVFGQVTLLASTAMSEYPTVVHPRVFEYFSFLQFLFSSLIYLNVLYRINGKVNLFGPLKLIISERVGRCLQQTVLSK